MIDRLRDLLPRQSEATEEEATSAPLFRALRLFSAELALMAGANATLHYFRLRPRSHRHDGTSAAAQRDDAREPKELLALLTPALIGSLAGGVQAAHALNPSDTTQSLTRLLNGAVVGLGLVGIAEVVASAVRGEERFSMAPLLFGYAGVLGFLLDRQENVVAEEEEQLERRARIVERLVPRRRPKLERIVVHV